MSTDRGVLYLDNPTVLAALAEVDALAVVHDALVHHARGEVILPAEAALRWVATDGGPARSLALPAAVGTDPVNLGLKVINANPTNPRSGLPRASGVLLLFDPVTARVRCIMQAEHVSSRRTAAVSAVAIQTFAPGATSLALIGAGPVARAHLLLCAGAAPSMTSVRIFDLDVARAGALAHDAHSILPPSVEVHVAESPRAAVVGADVVIPVTTTTVPYIERAWLAPDALVVNVSLDDCHAEVLEQADLLVVDDWSLVAADEHRLLGKLARAGRIVGPGETRSVTAVQHVSGELGTYVERPAATRAGLCVVNPFGMGIFDVALGAAAFARASAVGGGINLPE